MEAHSCLSFFIFIPQSPFISLSCLHVIQSSLTNNNLGTSCPFFLVLSSLSLFMSSVPLCADNQDIPTAVICSNTLSMHPNSARRLQSSWARMETPLQAMLDYIQQANTQQYHGTTIMQWCRNDKSCDSCNHWILANFPLKNKICVKQAAALPNQ